MKDIYDNEYDILTTTEPTTQHTFIKVRYKPCLNEKVVNDIKKVNFVKFSDEYELEIIHYSENIDERLSEILTKYCNFTL